MKELYSVPKKYHEFLLVMLFIFILLIFSFLNTYDVYNYLAINDNDGIHVMISYSDKDILNDAYVFINDSKYKIYDVNFSDIEMIDNNYYYEVTFTVDKSFDSDIIDLKIINNKQRIFSKFLNIIIRE